MDLRTALRIFRAHWVAIVLATLVGVGAAAGWSYIQPRVYTADASGYVAGTNGSSGSSDSSGALLANNLALSKVVSYVDIGSWRSVAEYAIEKLNLDSSPEALVRRVDVTNATGTVTIKVQASASTPEAARDLAEAWIQGMATEIEGLESDGGKVQAAVRLVPADTARLPTAPSSPNVRLALAIGGVAGLVVGIMIALLRFTLDRRIRSAELVERETGVAVVGTVPVEKSFTTANRLIPVGDQRDERLFAVSEALRELRTNIQFMDVDHPPRVVVVTSPLPGDGKSTMSANLALAVAASGQQVVLIDGDLRRPMIAAIFGLVEGAGITDVLAGRAEVDDVAQTFGHLDTLRIVAAGRTPPNPSEVLGSERMKDLLRELSREAMVIVDAPPLLPVTDAAVLTHSADGAIVVVGAGRTTIDVLKKAMNNLDRAGGRALGVVLNRVPRSGGGYYDYRYTGDYYQADQAVDDDADHTPPVADDADQTPPGNDDEIPGPVAETHASATGDPQDELAPLRRSRRRVG